MANTFRLNIITPDNKNISEEVVAVKTKDTVGDFQILAHHANIIVSVVPAVTTLTYSDGSSKNIFTSTGILYFSNNEANLVCDTANWPEEIDITRAETAKERADKRLHSNEEVDVQRAKAALARALARLELKNM